MFAVVKVCHFKTVSCCYKLILAGMTHAAVNRMLFLRDRRGSPASPLHPYAFSQLHLVPCQPHRQQTGLTICCFNLISQILQWKSPDLTQAALHKDRSQWLTLCTALERAFASNYYSLAFSFFSLIQNHTNKTQKTLLHKLQDTNQAGYLMGHCTYREDSSFP